MEYALITGGSRDFGRTACIRLAQMGHHMILISVMLCMCIHAFAQETDIRNATERYKNMNTLATTVVRTRHNAVFTEDQVTTGNFYFKKPDKMCIRFNEGKDVLLMNGHTFVMITDGKKSTAQGEGNKQLESLQALFKGLVSGEEEANLNEWANVEMNKQGQVCTLTLTPIVSDPKEKRKMLFFSFVLTLDLQSAELKSLRMNEKGENYTQYDFSNYVFDGEINDNTFNY